MKRGFTLVELSIVLVIIGLLIGGILVAQSMISAAKINSQVRQFQQFDIATANFKTKFGGLPGDNKIFQLSIGINPVTTGNNDGILDMLPCCQWHDGSEISNFWFQLTYTQMLNDGNTYQISYNGSSICGGVIVPKAIIKAGPHVTWYTNSTSNDIAISASGISSTGKNYYTMFQSCTNNSFDFNTISAVSSADLAAIDSKMDDSVGNTGSVVARKVQTDLFDPSLADPGACVDATGKYVITNTTPTMPECTPRIDMFSQIGGI